MKMTLVLLIAFWDNGYTEHLLTFDPLSTITCEKYKDGTHKYDNLPVTLQCSTVVVEKEIEK